METIYFGAKVRDEDSSLVFYEKKDNAVSDIQCGHNSRTANLYGRTSGEHVRELTRFLKVSSAWQSFVQTTNIQFNEGMILNVFIYLFD